MGTRWLIGRFPVILGYLEEIEIMWTSSMLRLGHLCQKEKCDQFYARYCDFLNQFDGFIVTHAGSFALLYENCNKPIIVVASTRYEIPFTEDKNNWLMLDDYFKERVKNNKAFIVANNKGDQYYFEHYTGIKPEHIPSLCLYTNLQYTGNRSGFIVHPSGGMKNVAIERLTHKELIQNSQLPERYPWSLLYDFQGTIHFPYNVSIMSIFEHYSANIPMFFPSKKYILQLKNEFPSLVLSDLSFFSVHRKPIPNIINDPNNVNDHEVVLRWIDLCDFYDEENMPYIQYFESFEHLEHLLQVSNLKEISGKMKAYNEKRKERVFKQWRDLLEYVIETNHL